jgi:hypothetical protein
MSANIGQIISEIKASGLRGRGGAGFPSGLKWVCLAYLPLLDRILTNNIKVIHEFQGLGQGYQASLPRRQRR